MGARKKLMQFSENEVSKNIRGWSRKKVHKNFTVKKIT